MAAHNYMLLAVLGLIDPWCLMSNELREEEEEASKILSPLSASAL